MHTLSQGIKKKKKIYSLYEIIDMDERLFMIIRGYFVSVFQCMHYDYQRVQQIDPKAKGWLLISNAYVLLIWGQTEEGNYLEYPQIFTVSISHTLLANITTLIKTGVPSLTQPMFYHTVNITTEDKQRRTVLQLILQLSHQQLTSAGWLAFLFILRTRSGNRCTNIEKLISFADAIILILQNIAVKQMEPTVNPRVVGVIAKQINECIKKNPDCVHVIMNEANILDIQADILGPVNTPYEGGAFRCKLTIENDFPNNPPKGYFLTKIFHPNVSEKGQICVNTLKKDWNPQAWSLYNIFEVIKCLLIVPFPESSLNEEAGKMFMEDYDEYFKHAKLITGLHAIPKELKKLENNANLLKSVVSQNSNDMNEDKEVKVETKNSKKQNDKKKWLKRI